MATPRWLRKRLVHTCTVRRDSGTAQTGSGQITPSWTSVYTAQPLRFAERIERIAAEGVGAAMIQRNIALMNGTADVQVDDRIAHILDADGSVVAAGTFTIERVLKRLDECGKVYHLSLELERVEIS